MENIYNTNDEFDAFDFSKLEMTKPIPIQGNNYFIKFLVNGGRQLYVQPPRCKTKQGIVNVGKRYYSDLMFTNENEHFIQWMENLETYCHEYIYKNRERWFDNDMELHDIENYFTSPMKLYKSGKYYTIRSNIQTVLDKPKLKIYNEDGIEIEYNAIDNNTELMTILEIQGIRCSARSFQIDIEIKQVMVLKPNNMFDKCLFKHTSISNAQTEPEQDPDAVVVVKQDPDPDTDNIEPDVSADKQPTITIENMGNPIAIDDLSNGTLDTTLLDDTDIVIEDTVTRDNVFPSNDLDISAVSEQSPEPIVDNVAEYKEPEKDDLDLGITVNNVTNDDNMNKTDEERIDTNMKDDDINFNQQSDDMEEVTFNLEELPENDQITLKKRNDVYYEIYREARKKAKYARDLALASYLEAKNIKNKYMLDDIDDSDDSYESDLDLDNEDDE